MAVESRSRDFPLEWTRETFSTLDKPDVDNYTAVDRLGFIRRATAVLKSNLIRAIEFGSAVARRLKRALGGFFVSSESVGYPSGSGRKFENTVT